MKYRVAMVRAKFEVADIEIEVPENSEGDEDAQRATVEMMAKLAAARLPEGEWEDHGMFHQEVYAAWPCAIVSEKDAAADGLTLDEYSYETMPLDGRRYLFLEANTNDGQGRLIMQPWYSADDPGLLEADITSDWVAEVNALVDPEGMKRL